MMMMMMMMIRHQYENPKSVTLISRSWTGVRVVPNKTLDKYLSTCQIAKFTKRMGSDDIWKNNKTS